MKTLKEQLDEHFINESELVSDAELEVLVGGETDDRNSETKP